MEANLTLAEECHLTISVILTSLVLQMFMSEAGKISQKIKVWFSDYFNLCDFLAITTFFIGFGLRLAGGEVFIPGRIVYCLNIIFWYVRLMDILAVNQQAGPYVMMIAKMVRGRPICAPVGSVVTLCSFRRCHSLPSWGRQRALLVLRQGGGAFLLT